MRMASGAEAIILPIAASHWYGSVRDRATGSSPETTTAVPARHTPPALTRTLGWAPLYLRERIPRLYRGRVQP